MSAANPASMRATVEGFNDATPYDPLTFGDEITTEEQLAHFIGSNSHSPNPQSNSSFSPPPQQDFMGNDEPPSAGTVQHRDSELFDFARIDSGFRVSSGFSTMMEPAGGWTIANPGEEDFAQTREMSDAIVSSEHIEGPPSRKSSGLATISPTTQMMSPAPSNETLSPTSPHGPFVQQRYKLLGGGEAMGREESMSTDRMTNVTGYPQMQHTPMSKGFSSNSSSSADLANNTHLTSPIVRVSRHESPARPHIQAPVTGKRSIDGSALLVPDQDFDAALDEEEVEQHDGGRGRTGLAPSARTDHDIIPSINEEASGRKMQQQNSLVQSWALGSATPDIQYLDPNHVPEGVRSLLGGRMRAKSTSKDSRALQHDAFNSGRGRRQVQNRSTPGPNVLVDEDSGEEEDEDDAGSSQESAPASVDGRLAPVEAVSSPFGHLDPEERPLEAFPWVDPIYLPSRPGDRSQPETSNVAIARFLNRNRDIETASRAATWGTRRMSDSTLDQVFGDKGLFSRLRLTSSKDKDKDDGNDEARSSLQEGVAHIKQVYRTFRSNSVNKRKSQEPIRPPQRTDTYVRGVSPHSQRPAHDRKESSTSLDKIFSRSPSQRKKAVSRPTTPRLDTGALAAITTAGLGMIGASPTGPTSPSHKFKEGFARLREGLHRHFSEDSQGSNGIADMMRSSGGPPVASVGNLTPPAPDNEDAVSENRTVKAHDELDDDARTTMGEPEKGVKMAMTPQKDLIIPNFDGFKTNVRDVNPRLDEWLVERLGQEQLRRYKRLVDYKVQHIIHIERGTCPSKQYCAAGEGFKRYFQLPKSAHKDSVSSADAEVSLDALDEDEQAIADGAVSEAQFPPGLPMPPVDRLPAEFECPYCFQVKKFTKPSDWSKHVHEDLQPFTCTFKHCSDPKSFKRKADWVRHENERHRQLEWWECTEEGCQHRCYRRDNFVQHLIREHKLPEPPNKPTKQPNKPAVRGPAKSKGRGRGNTANIHDVPPEEKVLLMVETCRHETSKSANEEKCRFCGNCVNSWKKLTVHLARHMEQLSIPVLELVKIREVNPDTIISPLEQRPPMALTPSPIDQQPSNTGMPNVANPYGSADAYGMPTMMSTGSMNPGMFAPMPGSYQTNVHGHPQTHQPMGAPQFADAPTGLYQAWPQQPMSFGATAAPSYGGVQAAYGAPNGQPDFGAAMYMDDTGANAFNTPPQMNSWNTHAGNGQFANMGGYSHQQAPRERVAQQGAANQQQQQQQQFYGGGWNNEYQ